MTVVHLRLSCLFLSFLGGFLFACKEASPPQRPQGVPQVADRPPLPSPPSGPLKRLEAFSKTIPASAALIGLFPADFVKTLVSDVGSLFPHLLILEDPRKMGQRLLDLYGIALDDLRGWCAFAWLPEGGPLLLCEALSYRRPNGTEGFSVGPFSGHFLERDFGRLLSVFGENLWLSGPEGAVIRAARARMGTEPSLASAIKRVKVAIEKNGSPSQDDDGALYFLDPSVAPWCKGHICAATAVFFSRRSIQVVAEAKEGLGEALQALAEAFWHEHVLQPFRSLGRSDRRSPIPEEALKGPDLLVTSATFSLRERFFLMRGQGDAALMGALLNLDLVQSLFAPRL